MKRSIVLAAIALCLSACQTNDAGKTGLDPEKVRLAVLLTCALAPTAADIAKLYTENKAVKTTEQATALLCAAALPIVRVETPPK
jgi:hypothetical protein